MKKALVAVLVLFVVFSAFAAAPQQKKTLARFYELRERTLDERGTPADVDQIVQLFSTDVRYEHPVAGISMTKEQAKAGMTTHLGEGRHALYTLRNVHFGENFAVVEYVLTYEVEGKKLTRNGAALFEFAGDKFKRVVEY